MRSSPRVHHPLNAADGRAGDGDSANPQTRAAQGMKVRVGMEASGHARWFERLLSELQFELWIGDAPETPVYINNHPIVLSARSSSTGWCSACRRRRQEQHASDYRAPVPVLVWKAQARRRPSIPVRSQKASDD
jgi:hypothetical protein